MTVAEIAPGRTRIGWIGLGVMGSSMCGHLMARGFSLTVHNRTRQKAEALLQRGATWADTPRGVAERSDVVFAIVGFPQTCAKSCSARKAPCPAASRVMSWST